MRSNEPLTESGKGLSKKSVQFIRVEGAGGKVLVLQPLTNGQLAEGFGKEGPYRVLYDPAAVQMNLNMLHELKPSAEYIANDGTRLSLLNRC